MPRGARPIVLLQPGERATGLVGRGAGLIFKGSGFYETDYKRSRPESKNGSAKETPAAKPDAAPKPEATPKPAKSEKPAKPAKKDD